MYLTGDFEVTTPWGYTRTTRPPGSNRLPELTWLDDTDGDDGWYAPDERTRQDQAIRARVHALLAA